MTAVTRRTPTCATSRSEHACTLFRLSLHSHWYITLHLAQVSWVWHPILTPCTCAVVSELLDFSFYLSLHFTVFFPSFLSMYSNDFDSVTSNLRNSANGTFVTFDDVFPNTDLVEEILGEAGSRSSLRVREYDSSQLVSQQNVAIQVLWSRCQSRLTLIARDLCHGKQQTSWEERVWEASCAWLVSRQTMGFTVLSCFTAVSRKERVWGWIWLAWLGTWIFKQLLHLVVEQL